MYVRTKRNIHVGIIGGIVSVALSTLMMFLNGGAEKLTNPLAWAGFIIADFVLGCVAGLLTRQACHRAVIWNKIKFIHELLAERYKCSVPNSSSAFEQVNWSAARKYTWKEREDGTLGFETQYGCPYEDGTVVMYFHGFIRNGTAVAGARIVFYPTEGVHDQAKTFFMSVMENEQQQVENFGDNRAARDHRLGGISWFGELLKD